MSGELLPGYNRKYRPAYGFVVLPNSARERFETRLDSKLFAEQYFALPVFLEGSK